MRVLIDTHLLLWWLSDDPSLSQGARSDISNPENTVFVSAVTMWEIWLKQSLGKLRLPPDFEQILARESFENLALTAAHASQISSLPWHHRDPFDRMLVAQARAENLTFLTADDVVARYGDSVRLVQ